MSKWKEKETEGQRRRKRRRENAKRSCAILLPSSRAYAREELTRAQLPFLGR